MGKSTDNFTTFNFQRRCAVFCLFDQLGEIFVFFRYVVNMLTAGKSSRTGSVQAVFVSVLWRNDTVGCHQDRSMERLELFFLFPPCISIVSSEVRIFFECRIVVCRKHLRMCIDINSGSFGLLKKHFQIFQIMTGNQNPRIFTDSNIDFCYFRISIGFCICLI